MSDGGCGDPGVVQGMAAELFDLASLLASDQQQALSIIEQALASMQIDPCLDPVSARAHARLEVMRTALRGLAVHPPASGPAPGPCVQDDDLEAAGMSQEQLRGWLASQQQPELRRELRGWLESLPAPQRVIFVQRAVVGQSGEDAARLLNEASAPGRWDATQVSQLFRQALCSLASALAHAPAHDALPA